MRRKLLRLGVWTGLGVAGLVVVFFAVVYVRGYQERLTAEAMVADLQHIEVGRSTIEDVEALARAHPTALVQEDDCTPAACSYRFQAGSWPPLLPWGWRIYPALRTLGSSSWMMFGSVSIEDRIVREKTIRLSVWKKGGPPPDRGLSFSSDVRSAERIPPECTSANSRLHPSYELIYQERFKGFERMSVTVRPGGPPDLSSLDLGCLTSLGGCGNVRELAPAAWSYLEKDRAIPRHAVGKAESEMLKDPVCLRAWNSLD